MVNYGNGKIYYIRSHRSEYIYVGSTCSPLSKRLSQHRSSFTSFLKNEYAYMTSFDIIKYDDAYIELVEDFSCERKEQLLAREGYWIRNTLNCVNKCVVGRNKKEYREDNKEKLAEFQKEYYQKNCEQIKEKQKKYSLENPEIRHAYVKTEAFKQSKKQTDKKFRQLNRDRLNVKENLYRMQNREEINRKQNEAYYLRRKEINCVCGSVIVQHHIKDHEKTKKHLEFLSTQIVK